MEISSVNQARVFLWMIVCGGVCTLVFDIFRGIRRYKSPQSSIILVQDLVLWSIEICIVYMVAFKLNYAKVRAYEIVALAIGSLLYFVLLSDLVVRTVCRATAAITKIAMCVITPATKFFGAVVRPVKKWMSKAVNRIRVVCNVKKILVSLCLRFKRIPVFKDKSVSESGIKTQKSP